MLLIFVATLLFAVVKSPSAATLSPCSNLCRRVAALSPKTPALFCTSKYGPFVLRAAQERAHSRISHIRRLAETVHSEVGAILARNASDVTIPTRKDMRFRSILAGSARDNDDSLARTTTDTRGVPYFLEEIIGIPNVLTNQTSMEQIMLLVSDMDRSVAFYRDLLNLTVLDEAAIEGTTGTLLGYPDGAKKSWKIWLLRDESTYPPYNDHLGYKGIDLIVPRFGLKFLAFHKDKIEALGGEIKQIRELCFEVPALHPKSSFPDGRYLVTGHLLDPDGHSISLFEDNDLDRNWIKRAKFFGDSMWRYNCFYKHLLGMKVESRRFNKGITYYPFTAREEVSQSMFYSYGDEQTRPSLEVLYHEVDKLWRNRGFEGLVLYTSNLTAALDWIVAHNTTLAEIHIGETKQDMAKDYYTAHNRLDYQQQETHYKWMQVDPAVRSHVIPISRNYTAPLGVEREEHRRERARLLAKAYESVDQDFFGVVFPERRLLRILEGSHYPLCINDTALSVHYKYAARSANTTKIGFWTDVDGYQTVLLQPNLH